MEELKKILLEHFERYPKMAVQDAIKLLYQHCFGCEHLLKDEELALSMLEREWDETMENGEQALWEDIGNGYGRLNLPAAKAKNLSLEMIGRLFVSTAKMDRKKSFFDAVIILKETVREGKTPFSCEDLENYLSSYDGKAVHHSKKYRACYHPSYRIIDIDLAKDLLQ